MKGGQGIRAIRSGGQTGADRGALDAARAAGVPICGWCPHGGWAEDAPSPPGVRAAYPELVETPSPDPIERTNWNVRDADATLIVLPGGTSPGTEATERFARQYGKPHLVLNGADVEEARTWLQALGRPVELNVAGPRESECPGAYRVSRTLIAQLIGGAR